MNEKISQLNERQAPASRNISTRQNETSNSNRLTGDPGYIRGECVSDSAVRSLSALYRPTFTKYPTFPSIYQTKYQRDFKYISFPVPPSYKDNSERSKYSRFKFGSTTHNTDFPVIDEVAPRFKPMPFSRNRKHNPQPSIKITQNYPDQVQWVWSKLEGRHNDHSVAATMNRNTALKCHRWNSR